MVRKIKAIFNMFELAWHLKTIIDLCWGGATLFIIAFVGNIQMPIWEKVCIILALSCFLMVVGIIIAWWIQRGRKQHIEFYYDRQVRNEIRGDLSKEIKKAKQIWMSVWVGTILIPFRTFEKEKGKITKLLILHPNADYLKFASKILSEPLDTYKNNIIQNTKNALSQKVRVYWTLEPIAGMVIANPEKHDGIGWARVDTFLPWTIADKYPSYIAYEDANGELFRELLRAFKESIGEHESGIFKDDITNQNKVFEITEDNLTQKCGEVIFNESE
jgi:hypothetical protein